jgi:hypothetical protein
MPKCANSAVKLGWRGFRGEEKSPGVEELIRNQSNKNENSAGMRSTDPLSLNEFVEV